MKDNYEMFLETVSALANSQGSYAKLAKALAEQDDKSRAVTKAYLNAQPPFSDRVDVIMWLEG